VQQSILRCALRSSCGFVIRRRCLSFFDTDITRDLPSRVVGFVLLKLLPFTPLSCTEKNGGQRLYRSFMQITFRCALAVFLLVFQLLLNHYPGTCCFNRGQLAVDWEKKYLLKRPCGIYGTSLLYPRQDQGWLTDPQAALGFSADHDLHIRNSSSWLQSCFLNGS